MAVYILARRPPFLYKYPITFRLLFNCDLGSHVNYIAGKFQSLPVRGRWNSGTLASMIKSINSILVRFDPHTTIINITKLSAYPITFNSLPSNIHKILSTRPEWICRTRPRMFNASQVRLIEQNFFADSCPHSIWKPYIRPKGCGQSTAPISVYKERNNPFLLFLGHAWQYAVLVRRFIYREAAQFILSWAITDWVLATPFATGKEPSLMLSMLLQ